MRTVKILHLYSKSSEPSRNENVYRISLLLCAARQIDLFSYKQVIQKKQGVAVTYVSNGSTYRQPVLRNCNLYSRIGCLKAVHPQAQMSNVAQYAQHPK